MNVNRPAFALVIMILIPLITIPTVRSSNIKVEYEYNLDESFIQHFYSLNDFYAEKINSWFMERKGDLMAFVRSPTVVFDLNLILDQTNPEFSTAFHRVKQHFLVMKEEYGFYGAIQFVDENGTVKMFTLSEEAVEQGTSKLILGKDLSDKVYLQEAWTGRANAVMGWKDVHLSNTIGDYAVVMAVSIYYDPTDDNVANGEYIGTLVVHINVRNSIWSQLRFKYDSGDAWDEEYGLIGLGETGEIYIVDGTSNYGISLSRYMDDEDFILTQKTQTTGVTEAIVNGTHAGIYNDYQYSPVPVYGVTYYLGEHTTGTDNRDQEDLDDKTSFGLNWVLLVEMDVAEVQASIQVNNRLKEKQTLNNSAVIIFVIILIMLATIIKARSGERSG